MSRGRLGTVRAMVLVVIILILDVPLTCEHVLLSSIAAFYHSQDIMSGRGVTADCGLRSEYIMPATVAEDGSKDGRMTFIY